MKKKGMLVLMVMVLSMFIGCATMKSTSSTNSTAKDKEAQGAKKTSVSMQRFIELIDQEQLNEREFFELFRVAKVADKEGYHICAALSGMIAEKATEERILGLYQDLDLYLVFLVGYVAQSYGLSGETADALLAQFAASPRGATEQGVDTVLEHIGNFGSKNLNLLKQLQSRSVNQVREGYIAYLILENGGDTSDVRSAFRNLVNSGYTKESVWLVIKGTEYLIDPPALVKVYPIPKDQLEERKRKVIDAFGKPILRETISASKKKELHEYREWLCSIFKTEFPSDCI